MRAARTATALLCIVALAAGAAGCGGSEVDYQEVPGPPADVTIPSDTSSLGDTAPAANATPRRRRRPRRPSPAARPPRTASPAPRGDRAEHQHGHRHDAGTTGTDAAPTAAARRAPRRRTRPRTTRRRRPAPTRSSSRTSARRTPAPAERGVSRATWTVSRIKSAPRPADRRREPSPEGGYAVPDQIPAPPTRRRPARSRPWRGRGVPSRGSPAPRRPPTGPGEVYAALTAALYEAFAVDQVLLVEVAQGAGAGDAHVMRHEGGEDPGYVQVLNDGRPSGTGRVVATDAPLARRRRRRERRAAPGPRRALRRGVRAVRAGELGRRGPPRGDLDLPRAPRARRRRASPLARALADTAAAGLARLEAEARAPGARRARTRRSCAPRAR